MDRKTVIKTRSDLLCWRGRTVEVFIGTDEDHTYYTGTLQLLPVGFVLYCRYKSEVFEGLSMGTVEHFCLLHIKGTYKTEEDEIYDTRHIWARSVKLLD